MKYILVLQAIVVFALTGCSKPDAVGSFSGTTKKLQEDNGCIERSIVPVTAHSISSAAVSTVNNVFNSNGINHSQYRYYEYTHDTLTMLAAPFTQYDQQTVRVDQYSNGVRIFTGDLVFNFLNNQLNYRGGDVTNGTSLNTAPNLTLAQLRKLFLDNIEQFDHAGNQYRDSCFKAEFGYFNLNAGTSYTNELLVKAWKVSLKNHVYPAEYPVAFYQDNDGKLIYYDNGIMTFH